MHKSLIIFLTIFNALILLIHLVVYKSLVLLFPPLFSPVIAALRIIFILLTPSFVIATFVAMNKDNWFTRIFYTISAYWFGFVLLLFAASVGYGLLLGATIISNIDIDANFCGKIFYSIATIVALYSTYNATRVRETSYEVAIPNIPDSWKGRKAVLISDLHLGQMRRSGFASKIVCMIQKQNPDIVFISGDLYDGVKVAEKDIVEPFKILKPKLGMYYATGNHEEHHHTPENYYEAIRHAGITVLRDEFVNVEGVSIVGVDHQTTETKEKFKNVLSNINIPKDKPALLIKHVPLFLDVAEHAGISLMMSGHTHNGQMFPFSIVTRITFKGYHYGMKVFKTLTQITSSGAATWGPPYRLGTKSEIVVITFV